MGIRFLCSACGKKLNIKEELAGKKGRCPKCNEKITIPEKSSLDNIEDPPKPIAKSQEPSPAKESSPAKEVAVQVAVKPTSVLKKEVKKTTRKSAKPSQPKKDAVPEVKHEESAPPPLPTSTETADSEVSTTEQVSAPDPKSKQDVFAEAPDANWFVRPSSGGQFGPAEPDVMKGWLSEGRVGLDSLVWREGWEEWQNAGEIFKDELGATPDPPTEKKFEEKPSDSSTAPQTNRSLNHQRARKKARTMGIVLVVGLAVVSITLAVVLFFVVKNAGANNNNKKKESACLPFEDQKNHNHLRGLSSYHCETDFFESEFS